MAKKRTFREWMHTQRKRPDHVGQLAEDMEGDADLSKAHPRSLAGYERYLHSWGAVPEAISALRLAWQEWTVAQGGTNDAT